MKEVRLKCGKMKIVRAFPILCFAMIIGVSHAQNREGTITVKKKKDIAYHYIITPDGDGQQDFFMPNIIRQLDGVPFVFTIWTYENQVIFKTEKDEPWNGISDSGMKAKPGRYLWAVTYENEYELQEKVAGSLEVYYDF